MKLVFVGIFMYRIKSRTSTAQNQRNSLPFKSMFDLYKENNKVFLEVKEE